MYKKNFKLLGLFIFISTAALSQAVPLDTNFYKKSYTHFDGIVSSDGKYIGYTEYSLLQNRTTIMDATSKWKIEILNSDEFNFSADGKLAVCKTASDSLAIIALGDSIIRFIGKVASYSLISNNGNVWLIYLIRPPENKLVILDLRNSRQQTIPDVSGFFVNAQTGENKILADSCFVVEKKASDTTSSLYWTNIANGNLSEIWRGKKAGNFVFDVNTTSVAFTGALGSSISNEKQLWFYSSKFNRAQLILDSSVKSKFNISYLEGFDSAATKLFVKLNEVEESPLLEKRGSPKVEIWTYFDPMLQTLQSKRTISPNPFLYSIGLPDRKITRLIGENEIIVSKYININIDHLLVEVPGPGDDAEAYWNRNAVSKLCVEAIADGTRKVISTVFSRRPELSPKGKFAVYWDWVKGNYMSYELSTNILRNITKEVKTKWTTYDRDDELNGKNEPIGISGWTVNDQSVLLHDQNDIILVDLTASRPPINLTKGFGKKNHLIFHIGAQPQEDDKKSPVNLDEDLVLNVFDRSTKDEGFFKLSVKRSILEKLSIEPYRFNLISEQESAKGWFFTKERVDFSPNLFYSNNLRDFVELTDEHPEWHFGAVKDELVNWRQLDGQLTQGILYKPSAFDPGRKYPLIITYYERVSDHLNVFEKPEYNGYSIDIPSFVNKGYLILLADIHFKYGNPGQSAYNSIVAAASYMMKKPWIDGKHLGLDGHSFAGYMTEYIITHSHLFAAAISACGWSNFISSSNRIRTNGHLALDYYEVGKQRMGGDLWADPGNYIQASPIFQAHHVTTPVLLMNNLNDGDVDFYEGVQFFNVLRRLGKRCWMLHYAGAGHTLFDRDQVKDFMIREQQFFDHYLQGAPSPRWMVEGVQASSNGAELKYDLEPSGIEPPANLLLPAEQKRMDSLQATKPKIVIVK